MNLHAGNMLNNVKDVISFPGETIAIYKNNLSSEF